MQKPNSPNQDDEEKKEKNRSKTKTGKSKTAKPKTQRKKKNKSEEEIALLKDQLLRTAAELKNFKSRTERETVDIILNANKSIIIDLLTVVDDFERSLKSSNDAGEHFSEGIALIYQKLMTILEKHGLKPMESAGKPFDVEKHDALMLMEKEGESPGVVLDEHEKGYYLNDKILRHAKVIVSK